MYSSLHLNFYWSAVLPSQPSSVKVEHSEATSIELHWKSPFMTPSPILYYAVYANNLNKSDDEDADLQLTNDITMTSFNVTDLLPGTTYELTLVAIYREDGIPTPMIRAGNSVIGTTRFTG